VSHTYNTSYSGGRDREDRGSYLKKKNPSQKRAHGVAQGVGPEFKPQYHKKKEKNSLRLERGVGEKRISICPKPGSLSSTFSDSMKVKDWTPRCQTRGWGEGFLKGSLYFMEVFSVISSENKVTVYQSLTSIHGHPPVTCLTKAHTPP
jgi:hypothetical protein